MTHRTFGLCTFEIWPAGCFEKRGSIERRSLSQIVWDAGRLDRSNGEKTRDGAFWRGAASIGWTGKRTTAVVKRISIERTKLFWGRTVPLQGPMRHLSDRFTGPSLACNSLLWPHNDLSEGLTELPTAVRP